MTQTTKVKVENLHFLVEKHNKTVIDFNFGRYEDSFTLKSDIHFFGSINPHVNLIEVNNCTISFIQLFSILLIGRGYQSIFAHFSSTTLGPRSISLVTRP